VFLPDGRFLCSPDGLWPQEGVAAEVDSTTHNSFGPDRLRTVERAQRMQAAGLTVVSILPQQLRDDPGQVIRTLREVLIAAHGVQRPMLPLVVRPPVSGNPVEMYGGPAA
jgi:hypothetical protein